MAISESIQAEILRLFHAEKWRVGTIARQLRIHHTTVARVLQTAGVPKPLQVRPSITDPFIPMIIKTLERYPTLPSSRLFVMVRERGYPGTSEGHFRRTVARLRPRKLPEAFLRLRTLPGEQAQVDWGHFGKLRFGSAERHLSAFVMVLSYSRRIFLRFYPSQTSPDLLRGHVRAFNEFGGVPRVLLYDNPKTIVLERRGDAIRFHPDLLKLAGHYRYEPRPVAVARGNEKGRVERAIRYIRTAFFAGRTYRDLDDLNAQAKAWCEGLASDRRWPEDHEKTVRQVYAEEQPHLLDLPAGEYPAEDCDEVRVGKTPYVRFDRNDYSVPHTYVRTTLTVRATEERVRILDGAHVVATHPRSYDKRRQIENPEHIRALVEVKREAREHRGRDRLHRMVPNAEALALRAVERGQNLSVLTRSLLKLLDQYGADEVSQAVAVALERDVPHANAVRQALERRRQARALPPPVAIRLDNEELETLSVRPHALSAYDNLETSDE